MAITFQSPLEELINFEDLKKELMAGRGPLVAAGCMESQKIHLLCELTEDIPLRLIVTYNESRAREILQDVRCFHENASYYPAKDVLFYQADVQGNLLAKERMAILKMVLEEGAGTVVTTIDACMDRIASPKAVADRMLVIRPGDVLDLEKIRDRLTALGYERLPQVESSGEFAIRGDILDVYPLTEENPIRIELWDQEVDRIRSFDCDSQRSMESLDEVHIYAANDSPVTSDGKYIAMVSLLDYFDRNTAIILDEPNRCNEKALAVAKEFQDSMVLRLEKGYQSEEEMPELLEPADVFSKMNRGRLVMFSGIEQRIYEIREIKRFNIVGKTVHSYEGHFDQLIADLITWKKEKYRVVLLAGSRTRAERLAGNIRDYDLPAFFSEEPRRKLAPGTILVTTGNVHKSFEYPQIRFLVISEGDLFGRERKKKKKRSQTAGERIQHFTDLNVGDYVVHENHGLGVYHGIEKIDTDGVTRDYIKISYSDGGNLYVPVTQMDLVQKYASADTDQPPKLNRLSGPEWTKTRSRVNKAVKDIAEDLVKLYAARQDAKGFVYGPDTVWQKEFEEQFPYEETEDQLRAIEAVKADMESGKIMDRLVCGDVGYGKTEIALRAAFKAVQDGKQVAYLAPTTILAQQHYNTFVQRMKDFPVNVELLCRFRTTAQQKETVKRLQRGTADIVIGTHRILSKDVQFKDLGLLIIDEEQRFGVTHKEKIKQLRENVNVISMTATPIPRTLHMSMIGIRDMSILEEPPMDRQPIQTYVMEYNDELVREAIQREIDRDGQVFYVYNQVRNIAEIAAHISSMVPDANVVYAHGQMKERELERIMLDFMNGEIDVLVSTTIIETGLDISNTNTIIIHDADRYGLSQLYQLRGRVGRSNRAAYAFLMYRRNRMLKEVAEKRLSAIREYTELGSGIKIAMRDLELRGAGNLLGAEQHGHMQTVGYDMYCKLLGAAVQEAKGEKKNTEFDTTIDLQLDAYIPSGYIRNEAQKMDVYKRIAGIVTESDYEEMLDELIDRFGEPPKSVQNLLKVARMKAMAHEAYVVELTGGWQQLRFKMYEKSPVDAAAMAIVMKEYKGALRFISAPIPTFIYEDRGKKNRNTEMTLETVKNVLTDLKRLMQE